MGAGRLEKRRQMAVQGRHGGRVPGQRARGDNRVDGSKPDRNPNFIDEPRRFNVPLSRAKWLTFVVGPRSLLMNWRNWSAVLVQRAAAGEVSRWPPQHTSDNYPLSPSRLFKQRGCSCRPGWAGHLGRAQTCDLIPLNDSELRAFEIID
jgi:hypothetical protein